MASLEDIGRITEENRLNSFSILDIALRNKADTDKGEEGG